MNITEQKVNIFQESRKNILTFLTEKNNIYYEDILTSATKTLCYEVFDFDHEVELYVMLDNKSSNNLLKYYLTHLIPSYRGDIIYADYNNYIFTKLFGYEPYHLRTEIEHLKFHDTRFFITGKAYTSRNNYFYVCHLPYYDLESSKTSDYFIWINNKNNKNKDILIKDFYDQIFTAVFDMANNKELNKIFFPNLGLTYGLEAIPDNEKQLFRNQFIKSLQDISKKYPDIQCYLCDEENLFTIPHPQINDRKNNFNYVKTNYFLFPINNKSLIVSPWNKRSFFGNGGLRNPEIEGSLISGREIVNSSYLHNFFFHEELTSYYNWIIFE